MIRESVGNVEIRLETAEGLFSPRSIDRGTRAMLLKAEITPGMKVLDLGCGAGPVGIYCAHFTEPKNVFMIDVNPEAAETARNNAYLNGFEIHSSVSDGFRDFTETGFDLILSNPPYQTDFAVARHFIEKGFNRLKIGGRMMMVTKRRAWYENKLRSVFGGCRVEEADGYFVFTAEKREASYASARKKADFQKR